MHHYNSYDDVNVLQVYASIIIMTGRHTAIHIQTDTTYRASFAAMDLSRSCTAMLRSMIACAFCITRSTDIRQQSHWYMTWRTDSESFTYKSLHSGVPAAKWNVRTKFLVNFRTILGYFCRFHEARDKENAYFLCAKVSHGVTNCHNPTQFWTLSVSNKHVVIICKKYWKLL